MTGSTLLWMATGLLVLAVAVLIGLIVTGARVVPMSRRRPADALPQRPLSRAADAASQMASRALGSRRGAVEQALEQAGFKTRPQDFMVLVASAMVAAFALGLLVWGPIQGLLLLLIGPIVAWLVVRIATDRRRKRFALQLDETLSILSGSLRAGYSLPQACATVANKAEEPTSTEFARVINESRVGRPFVEALEDSAQRMKDDDFGWIVQAIAINREVGGNLADVLEGVGATIRERTQLKRQVDALSAEGRFSAIVLGALPFVVFLAVSLFNPGYIGRFGESLQGILMLVFAAVLLVVGLFWLRAVVKIKY